MTTVFFRDILAMERCGWVCNIFGIVLIIVVLFFFAIHWIKSIQIWTKNRERHRYEQECRRREEEKQKEQAKGELALVERFVQSEEVHKMVAYICAGNLSNRPLYIEVNSNVIFADHSSGERIRYLFSEHRVSPLGLKYGEDEMRPIFAMAQAIDFILKNEYEVVDYGMIAYLKLKPNKSF